MLSSSIENQAVPNHPQVGKVTELAAAAPAIADIIILAVMGVSLVFGLFRGLLRELLSLVSWILAFWIAYRYSASVAQILDKALQNPTLSQAVSAVFVFVLVLVALMLLASLISKIFKAAGLAGMDRILGGLFGLGRAVVILFAALIVGGIPLLANRIGTMPRS